jgi:hypothetical protein
MASAKKCDRCGILYESSALPKTDYFIHKLTGDPRLPNMPVDLCPTCVKQLNEWMESPELTMVLIHPSTDTVVKNCYVHGFYTGSNFDPTLQD